MILVLLVWILILFVFFVLGFSVVKTIDIFTGRNERSTFAFDEFFFTGFLTLSSASGIISIFIPVGNYVLLSVIIISISLFLIIFREIKLFISGASRKISSFNKFQLLFLSFIIIFIMASVVQKITLGDTESYHAQTIQWIRKYAVVPGLGNIHARLAYNSMFFVISGLYTFQIRDILLFPLNGICYIILIIRLMILFGKEIRQGAIWKAVFYSLIFLISFLILIPDLNSPSPDIICAILIIYVFILSITIAEEKKELNLIRFILLNLIVFSCITFKISSLLLVSLILFFLNKEILKRIKVVITVVVLVFSSFIVRNYYLSGYVIYPFSKLDIYNTDWKIPADNVNAEKSAIEGWAKIWTAPYPDVVKMKIQEWILPWFKLLNIANKVLVTINFLSIFTLIIMLIKRDFFLATLQLIILINLVFWFLMAPDPRFAYGFIFLGTSMTLAYIIKLFESMGITGLFKYIKICLVCLLLLVISKRIRFPLVTAGNPSLWILPAPFGTVETKNYYSDFEYRVPIPEGGCFNVEIPCVPYPLKDIVLRGKSIQDGFKIKN